MMNVEKWPPLYDLFMEKVLIIGSNGMLGSAVTKYFSAQKIEVTEANRNGKPAVSGNNFINFDILTDPTEKLTVQTFDYVINCSGLIKHKIVNNEEAQIINGDFPKKLSNFFKDNSRIIQIATDCVFSGSDSNYSEKSTRDANDIYGLSKIIGEVDAENFLNLRTSVIGVEVDSKVELLEWVRKAPLGAILNGYENHFWNGTTTLAFAKVVFGIVKNEGFMSGTFHLVPSDFKSKSELIKMIAQNFHRIDLTIKDTFGPENINRTLSTIYPRVNECLWHNAGYSEIPTIEDMIGEYVDWIEVNR